MFFLRRMVGLSVALLAMSLLAYSQTQQGDIVGTIRDAQGAVIPAVQVRIINQQTGAVRELQSDEHGDYVALGFFPGMYRIEFEKTGFEKAVVLDVRVDPVTKKRVDVTLTVGSVATQVTVTGGAPVVKTEGATVSEDLPRVLFEKPMSNISRSGWTMDPAMWVPGSAAGPGGLFLWGGAGGQQAEIQVEGSQQNIGFFTGPTATEELSIQMGTPPAEYGRAVTTNVTFRSGTNSLHGEYNLSLKNQATDAVNQNTGPKVAPPGLSQWRHEFSVGGPVYLPKVYDGRNKTFFFFNFWRPKDTTSVNPVTGSIPSPRLLAGDFSKYVDGSGKLIPIRDPQTGLPFPGNVIPSNRISSVAKAWDQDVYVDNFGHPWGYIPGLEDTNLNNALSVGGGGVHAQNWTVKIDQNLGTQHVFSFSLNHHVAPSYQSNLCAGCYTGARELRYGGGQWSDSPEWRPSLGYTYTVTPHLINQLRLAVSRAGSPSEGTVGTTSTKALGADELTRWGIQGVTPTGLSGYPNFQIPTWGYWSSGAGSNSVDSRYQAYENLTYIRGNHSIKGGFEVIKFMQDNTVNPGFGNFTFDGRFTGEPFADLLLGLPGTFSRSQARVSLAERIIEKAAYAQDDWRVTSKLNLSYGLRWDRYGAPYDKNGLYYNFDPGSGKIVVPNQFALSNISALWPTSTLPVVVGSTLGYPAKLINPNQRWLPRFGFAYRPTGKGDMVVRGGIGVYNSVFRFGGLQTSGPFTLTEAYDNSLSQMRAFPNPFGATAGAATGVATGNSVSKDFRPDYLMSYNVTLEKQLWMGWGIRVSYLGSKSTQLAERYNMNSPVLSPLAFAQSRRPYPNFQNILRVENGSNGHYNSEQVVLTHPFRNGLHLEVSYTHQKEVDDTGLVGTGNSIRDTAPAATIDYAYDRRRDMHRSGWWPTHDFLVNYAYDLPFGRGQKWLANTSGDPAKWILARIVGGWSSTGYFNWHSGNFFTPMYTGYDPGNILQTQGRPNYTAGCNPYTNWGHTSTSPWFNTNCFTAPAPGTLGNTPINFLEGPALWVATLNPYKEFHIPHWEQGTLRVGAWIYNIFNNGAYWSHASGIYGSYPTLANGSAGALVPNPSGTYLSPWYVRRGTEGAFQRQLTFMATLKF